MKKLWLIGLLLFINICFADIYKETDANGNIFYTDTPTKTAKKIETIQMEETFSTVKKPSSRISEKATTEATIERQSYLNFSIVSPKDQETIQNQPNIILRFAIQPALQMGDKIQVFLDEQPIGEATASSEIDLGHLERGTHTFKAAIIDKENKVIIISKTITVYIHYASANKPTGQSTTTHLIGIPTTLRSVPTTLVPAK